MTILTSIILVVSIVAVATFIGYYVQRGQPTMDELWEDPNKQQVLDKTTPQIEDIEIKSSEVVQPASTPQQKPTAKSKKKYYPRKPKTQV
jgi:hypothetical protein